MALLSRFASATLSLSAFSLAAACVQPDLTVARLPPAGPVERGRYLVSHVALCSDCHSPRLPDGRFDPERWLSGVDCFVDVAPADPEAGCISTKNLTQHATGLLNRSDTEIKDAFMKGQRPDGKALHPFMPYSFFGNMHESDADAIVAYLRTVKGVEHRVRPSQTPFLSPPAPAPRVPEALIPLPRAEYADQAAALRGRYLAGNIGACFDCHTPRENNRPVFERAFQGGMRFGRDLLGLPANYPETIYSANLTPHATGIGHYTVADVVRALLHGEDKDGGQLCEPMPAGPHGPLGGMSEADASDIAHYLLSLPPAENSVPDCNPGSPSATSGTAAAGETWWSAERAGGSELWLSQTGLYQDIAARDLAPSVREFRPAFELWSDGAEKRRWLRLPPGTSIDNADPEDWRLPVGGTLFKEFSSAGRRIETRVIARTGPGAGDYWMGAFVWNDDGSDARFTPAGLVNAHGTPHDVPSSKQCATCHNGARGKLLGLSAVQQPDLPEDLLRKPPGRASSLQSTPMYPALGYLHANCAHCHNPRGSAFPDTDLDLRLSSLDETPEQTGAYRTALSKPVQFFRAGLGGLRVAPGDPERSALLYRMQRPERELHMPPLATEALHTSGIATVQAWIESLGGQRR